MGPLTKYRVLIAGGLASLLLGLTDISGGEPSLDGLRQHAGWAGWVLGV